MITDIDLLDALGASSLTREPYEYATSAPLELLGVTLADGTQASYLLKHIAQDAKPERVRNGRREIETYRRILASTGIGPRCRASGADWLVIDKVRGTELWQVGDAAVWDNVARWLRAFHVRFDGGIHELNPHLLVHDADWFAHWAGRASAAAPGAFDGLRLDRAAEAFAALPRTLVHGEFYPSNVLVSDTAVWPVDWEMSACGPAMIDLAALASGWPDDDRDRLLRAYGGVDLVAFELCRLALALQWVGWSTDWAPPPEHAKDWVAEALDAAARTGLCGP